MACNRFINNALLELQNANRSPIYGYQHLPVLTLEQAIERIIPLVPGVLDYVSTAKKKCNQHTTLLTRDESAAIYLYSMPISFFSCLNNTLRAKDRHALKPWFAFMKLFTSALEKLPSINETIWRGVSGDVGSVFDDGNVQTWWSINSCSMGLNIVQLFLGDTGTVFAIDAIHAKDISTFSVFPEEQEVVLMPGTCVRAKSKSLNFIGRFFLIHLEEETSESESQTEPSYLFGLIKQEYQRNSRIERIINSSKSFPIEQSYINLAIVENKEQQEKEKKLLDAKLNNEIIDTFEEIYGRKTNIEIKDIFEKCDDQTKNILVLGRAGIGKTTFCRYVAYQWAMGTIWQQYDLVVFIRLRSLTESRYPPLAPGTNYSPYDLVKKEYFHHGLSEKDESLLKEQLDKSQVLWLLDGYDEIVQNVPSHLQYLLEQLLKTPHHILTSRPYLNTLSYKVQLEITGFTDDNVMEYVPQFFDQIKEEIDNAQLQAQKLLTFLGCNPRIWGIVHIPVNLELICSLWCNTDWSETTMLTMTTVYDKMTEWLCRRHLEKQNIFSLHMTKEDVYEHCHKELAFLESLAFNAMQNKTIILGPKLLRVASKESDCSLYRQPHLLNIGILKSLDYKPLGTHIQADKNHYFVHLSFQELFAARYLVKALKDEANQKEKAIEFIKSHKYNQRYELVFSFSAGLLSDSDDKQSMNCFWNMLLGRPLDLIGFRHVQIIISCMEESGCNRDLPLCRESVNFIIEWINCLAFEKYNIPYDAFLGALRRSPSVVNQPEILDTFIKLYKDKDNRVKQNTSTLISDLPISNPYLIHLYLRALNDEDAEVRRNACQALEAIGEKAATNEVINGLVNALGDTDRNVSLSAFEALGKMGEKAATNEVINGLVNALGDTDRSVRESACNALGAIGEKAATNEVINRLVNALEDTDRNVSLSAFETLGKMGEKAATNEVINRLVNALGDTDRSVRESACTALGNIGEKAATNEVINRLVNALEDTDYHFRRCVRKALEQMNKNAPTNEIMSRLLIAIRGNTDDDVGSTFFHFSAINGNEVIDYVINNFVNLIRARDSDRNAYVTFVRMVEKLEIDEVINRLLTLLGDTNDDVRSSACIALGAIAKKAATNEVINRLVIAFGDTNDDVSRSACFAVCVIGREAATNKVVNRLMIALEDADDRVRRSACVAFGTLAEKAGTNEVINRLMTATKDANNDVRESACFALSRLGKKAGTNEVIDRLMILLGDTNDAVRRNACFAVSVNSEKVATNEMINELVNAVGDTDPNVRESACKALGKIGEKTATNEVINILFNALGDTNYSVRRWACEALGKIGEKTATNEVINRLFNALGDTDRNVRDSAFEALGKIGEKTATNEVIEALLDLNGYFGDSGRTLEKICDLLPCMSNLKEKIVEKLSRKINQSYFQFGENINPEKFIKAFLDTKISFWLPIIKKVFIRQGHGITVSGNNIVVYGMKEPVELHLSNKELGQHLQNYLGDL